MAGTTPRVALTLLLLAACGQEPSGERVRFTVARGQSLTSVADSLAASGIIDSPGKFRLLARISGKQRSIPAGIFELPARAGEWTILRALVAGPAAMQRLVVPEGFMLGEIADAAEERLGIPAAEFLRAAHDSTMLRELGVPGGSFEGYLYPSTYYVRIGATAGELIRQMVGEFRRQWRPGWDDRAAELGLTPHEAVILASIIEGEVRYDTDRAYVSSVYHNRLRIGMRLQADPTVIYGLGTRRRLFERDYQLDHHYNTYQIDGLPPGPIGQPSAASIEAALNPATTNFLFFVADARGHHVFSRTLSEHVAAIREIRSRSARE